MSLFVPNTNDVLTNIQAIDQKLTADINEIQEKLEYDIQALRGSAEEKINHLREESEVKKKFEIDETARKIQQETGIVIDEIQSLAYS